MGPSPSYHPPEGEECETSVEHGLPLWAELAVGYCSRRPRPSPMWGSRFVGAREVGPWVGEQKPLGKSLLRGNPSPESTYLPTSPLMHFERLLGRRIVPHLLALFHLPVTCHQSCHIPPPAESRGGWPLSSTPIRHSPPAESLGNQAGRLTLTFPELLGP